MRPERADGSFDRDAEEKLFEKFVRGTRGPLRRYAVRLTDGDQNLADDLVQETYLRLWRAWPDKSEVIVSVHAYAFRTLDNCAKNYWRTKGNWPVARESDIRAETEFIAEEHAIVNRMALREAVAALPDPIQSVIRLNVIEARPMAEVAEMLDLAEGTCRNYKTAGMRLLRPLMTPD
ncbi:RNA polymerase sigma factor [Amycolatopsis sp. TNS106]|uniref:RNA polymerase sigma factor n=1 Tax=Amycolatopsis sp. TNS106 TaxID=2861750 RepID=UPI001C59B7AB|nr:sigma-70 family RNA polymerase sigma factor [Amycolatopsis sp. TNS106]